MALFCQTCNSEEIGNDRVPLKEGSGMSSRQLIRLILRIVTSVDVLVESIKKIAKGYGLNVEVSRDRSNGH